MTKLRQIMTKFKNTGSGHDTDENEGLNTQVDDTSDADQTKPTLASEVRFYAIFVFCFMLFSSFGWGHYRIPSESMQPALEVGDRLYVSKFSYGYSRHDLPWGHKWTFLGDGIINPSYPMRGDVAVLRHPGNNIVMIKRVVGLPGDTVEYRQGRLLINDNLIDRVAADEFLYREHEQSDGGMVKSLIDFVTRRPIVYNNSPVKVTQYKEQFPGEDSPHDIYERSDGYENDKKGPFTVPAGHVFFIGDNRDNSTDSRAFGGPGYVPLSYVIGRAERMVLSFKRCEEEEGLRCPGSRWFQKL